MVISTIGRLDSLGSLFADLKEQTVMPECVIVVNQSEICLDNALAELRSVMPVDVISSPRGLSAGRNRGGFAIADRVDFLTFPNDTSRYSPQFIANLVPRLKGCAIGAVSCVDELGPRYAIPNEDVVLDKENVWKILEPGLIISSTIFVDSGGFDEMLGSGASSPWQSGEGTDLLLRIGQRPTVCRFMGQLSIFGKFETSGLQPRDRRRKLRAYGRGYGFVQSRWQYSKIRRFRSIMGALTLFFRSKGKYNLRDSVSIAVGRVEGLLGRTFDQREDQRAVHR
ncbi:glycosyltransferase family 2 protein [Arthrobacter sp. TS-15]|uniref:glycosyltransferase family 2 protein n=1 Tax=Arthrobacter sp. TS-15 TaxID=2510797 RepID=UPI00115E54F7|nr:glycosyltransferase family A protein [Arthrobacter sp. TS-15]TQS92792.1 glycosyltransferase family 2 protein [Arthrobacter sp. TS-15]